MGKKPIVYIISKLVVSVNVQIKEIQRQQWWLHCVVTRLLCTALSRGVCTTPVPADSFLSSGQCLLLSVDQFKCHLLCEAVSGPPRYMSHLLTYAPTQLGTHFFNTLLSVPWSLSSPSDSEWLQDGRCLPHVFPALSSGPYRSVHCQINDKMSQRAGKEGLSSVVMELRQKVVQCTEIVCPLSELGRYTDN